MPLELLIRFSPILVTLIGFAVLAAGVRLPTTYAQAGPCNPPIANPIVCENSRAGNPEAEWGVDGDGDPSIQGYATDISVNRGETVRFKVKTGANAYRLDIYRLGYYGGLGARKVATVQPSASLPQNQPNCLTEVATGLIDCGNWAVSASWAIPSDAVSGIYVARPVRTDTGGASHIVFVVRDDNGGSELLFQTSDTTWQAYNAYGGNSLYVGEPVGRAYKVSYNRPFNTRSASPGSDASWLFNAEYPMLRWLEANGYKVSYSTGLDSDRRGAELLEHKILLSVGHDEYWSGQQRANVEAARAAGVSLAFFSGNEVFWKTRWENSIDGSGTPYRTLVSYKETHANAKVDPNPTWTGTWRDPRFSPPSDGGRPENSLTGTLFMVNGPADYHALKVPAADGKMRFWRNTSVANLGTGQTATLSADCDCLIGYEWDEDVDNGHRPPGLIRLSTTTESVPGHLQNHGSTYAPGTATHHLTLYRHASGALVFGAGTVDWAHGLDGSSFVMSSTPEPAIRQATVNLFADMGAQPGTLQSGLVAASASTDGAAPTSTITTPAADSSVSQGAAVTISGTAADSGGGVVGAVEVSVDGGTTWHAASGRASWSYAWTPAAAGSATIKSRAVDDSGNIQNPATSRTVTVAPRDCPCSIWPASATPSVASQSDGSPFELGLKFRSDADGYITGLRFYKGAGNTGTHVANLWTIGGTKLATATFTNETAAGWQQVLFGSPVAINASTTYVASYHAPNGHFAVNTDFFATAGVDNAPLHAPPSTGAQPNGVYKTGPSGFPNQTFNASNYWVDVVFDTAATDTIPPAVSGHTPAAGATKVAPDTSVTATFSEAVNAGSISFVLRDPNNATVPASVTYDAATRTATLDPTASLAESTSYTATISGATDVAGNPMAAPLSWTFSTTGPATSIWDGSATPAVASAAESQAVELGVKFRTDVNGYISGLRFYKGLANTGTHVGNLWTSSGTKLATATFANETASGWQQVLLAAPVAVTANTTYVASYHAPNGGFAVNLGYFATGVDNYPLRALADGVDGANGLYKFGPTSFPNQTYQASNYWVDVVFNTAGADTVPPTLTARSPAPNATKVSPLADVMATFSEAVTAASITFQLRGPNNAVVPAAVTYDAATRTATLDPNAPLAMGTSYTATVSGATDGAGNPMAPVSWSFSTPSCPCSIWDGSTTPAVAATSETQAVELGVKFRSDIDGYITGIRFYKGAGNTGTHVGSLWSASGTLLGSATFTGETATGWQQVLFGSPIAINANTTYVASYHAPNGHFAVDTGYFDHGPVGGLVRALADGAQGGNGLYRFGASGFPTGSYQASNYWVDVVFDTSGGSGGGAAARVAAPAPDAPAERGGSLGLNGSSGYATVPHHTELNVTGDWTVEAWFKDESPGGFNHPETYLLTKGDTAADDEVPYFLAIERGDLVVGERTDGTDQVARYDLAAGGVRARTWHHVAATMQASSRTLTIYLDGKRVHQVRLDAHSATGNPRPLTIGRNGSRGRWRGNLDDVRIWNVVRSEAQIRSAYEEELDDAPAGLVGNWKFNERRGASSADDGGTAQDATLRGGAKRAHDVHP